MARSPASIVSAGLLYGTAGFALGFLLGVVRALWVAPRLGAPVAVVLEAPLMLAATWPLAQLVCGRLHVPGSVQARLAMGTIAFVLLMLLEALLGLALGRSLESVLRPDLSPTGLVGLTAQMLFALWPMLQRRAGVKCRST